MAENFFVTVTMQTRLQPAQKRALGKYLHHRILDRDNAPDLQKDRELLLRSQIPEKYLPSIEKFKQKVQDNMKKSLEQSEHRIFIRQLEVVTRTIRRGICSMGAATIGIISTARIGAFQVGEGILVRTIHKPFLQVLGENPQQTLILSAMSVAAFILSIGWGMAAIKTVCDGTVGAFLHYELKKAKTELVEVVEKEMLETARSEL